MWMKYYILKAIPIGNIPEFLFHQAEKNELFLSANVKLCGMSKVAYIKERSLAEQFKEACMIRLQTRYGAEFELEVVECESRENEHTKKIIEKDTEIINKRLATNNFAPNKPV